MTRLLMRFAISGGLATAVHISLFVVLVEGLLLRPVIASGVAFCVALLVSYGMNYHWTFSVSGRHSIMLPRFAMVAILGLIVNLGITYAVVDVMAGWYGYALVLVVLIVPSLTFLLSRLWVFNAEENRQG